MKIGFIGGFRDRQNRHNVAEDYYSKELDWQVRVEKPRQKQSGFQRTITITTEREMDIYNLMILKKSGELKFFYVLEGMNKDEIKSRIDTYWDNSDMLGYDFD
ncbi:MULTISPECIES: hypothetical protein [Acinetobacter]|uniref:Uncharacterized protein n=1 Tax=Acinetobacter piscicola TaxID=2006115 RepID=A0A7S7AGN0_9GAMM|nr:MULTISPECIES: hypothetical protein [Acinetobacter]QOW45530.1 hypothetical protein G0028_06235 [Acinetobacter piscicola]